MNTRPPVMATLTLNPALDLTLHVESLELGGLHRAGDCRTDPGGKGINVSRVLREFGATVRTLAVLGGAAGRTHRDLLDRLGLPVEVIDGDGETRINVVFAEASGRQTKVNQAGPAISPAVRDALMERPDAVTREADILVLSGSLPPGLEDGFYAALIELARGNNCRCALDADRGALREGIRARPWLVKPNAAELEAFAGRRLESDVDRLSACRAITATGVDIVVASFGSAGAMAVTATEAWCAPAPAVTVQNVVGLGDSLLAGVLARLSTDPDLAEALRWGVAAGAASAAAPPTLLCRYNEIRLLAGKVRLGLVQD